MSTEGKINTLRENLKTHIDSFDKWSANNKQKAFVLKMFITAFSATTTILLGLQGIEGTKFLYFDSSTLVKNVALILSALITLFCTWDAFFNHRVLWINLNNTANQLKAIRDELQFLTSEGSEGINEEEVKRLFDKYQAVLDSANMEWMKLRNDKPHETD